MKEHIFPVFDVDLDSFQEYIGFIRTKPELIRCRDCKYYPQNPRQWNDPDRIQAYIHCEFMGEKDYCSKAIKKEDIYDEVD